MGALPKFRRWPKRAWLQAASFLFANSYFLSSYKGFCYPALNCWACPSANFACPLGALQNASSSARLALRGGASWSSVIPLYILGTLFFFSALFGRMMCGWLCPFGALQDLLGRLGPRRRIRGGVRYLRYAILLGLVFIVPFYTGEAWFSKLCPMGALEAGIPQPLLRPELRPLIGGLWGVKMALLALTLLAAIIWRRAFCGIVCPLGAIFSLMQRFSVWQIDYERSKCTDCLLCIQVCPQGLDPRREVNSHSCIGCLECQKCPFGAIQSRAIWQPAAKASAPPQSNARR